MDTLRLKCAYACN